MSKVRVAVLRDVCIGSANCSAVAPETFDHDHTGVALVLPGRDVVDDSHGLREAVALCPVGAVVVSSAGTA